MLELPPEMTLDPRTGHFFRFGVCMRLTPGERLLFTRLLDSLGFPVLLADLRDLKDPPFSVTSIRVLVHRLRPAVESALFSIHPAPEKAYIMRDQYVNKPIT